MGAWAKPVTRKGIKTLTGLSLHLRPVDLDKNFDLSACAVEERLRPLSIKIGAQAWAKYIADDTIGIDVY